MANRSQSMKSIAQILSDHSSFVSRKNKTVPTLRMLDVVKEWPCLVGDLIAKRSSPIYVKGGSLTIQVTDSSWANELQLLSQSLLQKISSAYPDLKIKKLRFIQR
jgi:predicted nucleic acid-binding Zn ribbon protein